GEPGPRDLRRVGAGGGGESGAVVRVGGVRGVGGGLPGPDPRPAVVEPGALRRADLAGAGGRDGGRRRGRGVRAPGGGVDGRVRGVLGVRGGRRGGGVGGGGPPLAVVGAVGSVRRADGAGRGRPGGAGGGYRRGLSRGHGSTSA